jgi:hypothetical protein
LIALVWRWPPGSDSICRLSPQPQKDRKGALDLRESTRIKHALQAHPWMGKDSGVMNRSAHAEFLPILLLSNRRAHC